MQPAAAPALLSSPWLVAPDGQEQQTPAAQMEKEETPAVPNGCDLRSPLGGDFS